MNRIAALNVAVVMAAACGAHAPTAPSPGTSLALICGAPAILAGDVVVCKATVGSENVGLSPSAAWTSSDPKVATSLGLGLFIGRSEGQAILTATYSAKGASAPLIVHLEDVLRATAAAYQGTFKVGTTATLWLQGFYGVASADHGRLTLVVTDQAGATVSTSAPLTVSRGADQYLISTTFSLPAGTTRICRKGVLQIGSSTLTVVPDSILVPCFAVTP